MSPQNDLGTGQTDWVSPISDLDWVNLITGLAWPVVAITLTLFFGKPISELLGRISRISREGIETRLPSQDEALSSVSPAAEEIGKVKADPNPLVEHWVGLMRPLLDQAQEDTGLDRETLLVRAVARLNLGLKYEQAFNAIFGSQISALQFLNTMPSVDKEALRHFYEQGKQKEPVFYSTYSFEQWLNFLISIILVTLDGQNVSITAEGQDFLKYLVDRRYSLEKRA